MNAGTWNNREDKACTASYPESPQPLIFYVHVGGAQSASSPNPFADGNHHVAKPRNVDIAHRILHSLCALACPTMSEPTGPTFCASSATQPHSTEDPSVLRLNDGFGGSSKPKTTHCAIAHVCTREQHREHKGLSTSGRLLWPHTHLVQRRRSTTIVEVFLSNNSRDCNSHIDNVPHACRVVLVH